MTLLRLLADHALETRPLRAAVVLERLPADDAVAVLETAAVPRAAAILPLLSPDRATAALEHLETDRAARLLGSLDVDTATRLLRRIGEDRQNALLEALPPRLARAARALLRFPENTAGALMDPDVLALPMELSAREALARVRTAAEHARYNLYVLDQARLVGALNLRELLIARGRLPLSDLMVRNPHRLLATADRATVVSHPGWRTAHSLPVVDDSDTYLGAVRYRALRALEEELRMGPSDDVDTGAAFGELITAGARGLLDALAGTAPPPDREGGSS